MILVTVVALLGASLAGASDFVSPHIVYKYTDNYRLEWHDRGSGARLDGAIWKVLNYQSDYCSLGDVATGSWDKPTKKAILVSQRKPGVLVKPTGFTWVWSDQSSGAYTDVTIYKMNAPEGYTCLGHVGIASWKLKPNRNVYCCVKDEYVVQADSIFTWNDKGSGARYDISLWDTTRKIGDAQGIVAGHFVGVQGYSRPDASRTYLLKSDGQKVRDFWTLPVEEEKPLSLFEVQDLDWVWDDRRSAARSDFSIWRARSKEGYYPVGDIAVDRHSKPHLGFLLKANEENSDAVRLPVSYTKVWNDKGSFARYDCQIYKANCPPGYVALGDVAIASHTKQPPQGSIYCVKNEYTIPGTTDNLAYVWADYGSHARQDATVYLAIATSNVQQGVQGFRAIASHDDYPSPPYLLNKKYSNYWSEKPIEKMYMYNVQYDLRSERKQSDPDFISSVVIENDSSSTQTVTKSISYSQASSNSFTFTQAIQLGVSVEFTAGLPLIGSATTTVEMSTTTEFSTGEETTVTQSETIVANVELPAKSRCQAVITVTKYKADIPFTATIKKVYFDASESVSVISGVYKGVQESGATVSYGETEPL